MSSAFTWLDQSDQQRRKVLDLLAMFRERETVDELGLGSIRDAFADVLFPGTSAPQTRARYFLFVPWMYLQFERKKVSSAEIRARARRFELDLIDRLLDAGETDGVIGKVARRNLQRLPSSVYWSGLRRLGIFPGGGSQDQYHASLDNFYRRTPDLRTDDGDAVVGRHCNWHPQVPAPPDRFDTAPTLALRPCEAEYLRDQIQLSAPQSLFAAIVRERIAPGPDEKFAWDNARYLGYSPTIAWQLQHARNFSEVMRGAALLYNLILAELTKNDELQAEYEQGMQQWAQMLETRASDLRGWQLDDLWRCAESEGARIALPTKTFVTDWCGEALHEGTAALARSKRARDLVERRERALKRKLARVDNQRARERYNGAAGTLPLSYRWANASRIAADIIKAAARNDA